MKIRWVIAAIAALALAFFTLDSDLPNPFGWLRTATAKFIQRSRV